MFIRVKGFKLLQLAIEEITKERWWTGDRTGIPAVKWTEPGYIASILWDDNVGGGHLNDGKFDQKKHVQNLLPAVHW